MYRFGNDGEWPLRGVFRPPYSTTKDPRNLYAMDSRTVESDVRKWCIENGDNRQLRIALCGHVGQHEELEALGWSVTLPKKNGGYQGADDRERIWFSPHCVKQSGYTVLSLF